MNTEIDSIIEAQVDPKGPGAAVAVVKDGVVLHRKGYGLADLEWGIPIRSDTVFRLASITKQFTAMAIMMLQDQGKLSIEDPLTKYLPDYPTSGHDVTVHHLLTHTSGIKSYTSIEGFFENMSMKDRTTEELSAVFSQVPFDFKPGSRFRYNNSGYFLLGIIIEKAAGTSYGEFIRKSIFGPLGMKNSCYLENEPVVPHRASGYERSDDGYRNARYLSMTLPFAAGALGSTAADLIIWERALTDGRLLDEAALAPMFTSVTLDDGETADYGFGWELAEYRGRAIAHHGGGINGFSTFIARFPDDSVTAIVLSNLSGFDSEGLAVKVARIALGLPLVERAPAAVAETAVSRLVGKYVSDEYSAEVGEVDGRLVLLGPRQLKLVPMSETAFYVEGDEETEVRFDLEEAGKPGKLTVTYPLRSYTAIREVPEQQSTGVPT